MKKRIISLLLTVSLLAGSGVLPSAAAAEQAVEPTSSLQFGRTIALGRLCAMVIKEDGTLWTWGHNNDGMMGVELSGKEQLSTELGDMVYTSAPIQVPIDKPVVSVDVSDHFTSAITADGELWNWGGKNAYGYLGRETDSSVPATPGRVMGNVQDVSCGINHAAALTRDGAMWVWGGNSHGQLGKGVLGSEGSNLYHGMTYNYNYEVLPIRVLDNAAFIEAGGNSTFAILNDGSLWGWGNNNDGVLGSDTSVFKLGEHDDSVWGEEDSSTQVREPGVYAEILRPNGGVIRLTSNGGPITSVYHVQTSPIKIMDNVKKVSMGSSRSAILKNDGSLWTTGQYHYAPEADDDGWRRSYTYAPEKVMDGVADVEMYTRNFVIAALKDDGSLWTWGGFNSYGELGWGTDDSGKPEAGSNEPTKVLDNVVEIAVGEGNIAALKSDGSLWMSGANALGQLGGATDEKQSNVFIKVMDGVALPASYTQKQQTIVPIELSSTLADTAPIQSEGAPVWDTTAWGNRYMTIPDFAVAFNGNTYAFYSAPDWTWDEAQNYCLSVGGHLATITSREEQEFANWVDAPHWIGARRGSQGGWSWVTGESWGYSAWYSGQNDNYGGYEDAAILWGDGWSDVSYNATGSAGFVCEWETSGRQLPTPPAPAYAVTFVTHEGAQLDTLRKQVTQGQTYGWMPTPSLSGWTFVGWYDAPEGGRLVTSSTVVNLKESQFLYSMWTPVSGGPAVPEISYSFSNSRSGFNYPNPYIIPEDRYQYIFGFNSFASQAYSNTLEDGWGGNCFGMCATASMLYMQNVAGIAPGFFHSGASVAGELKIEDMNSNLNMNLRQWIECVHVSQSSPIIGSRRQNTRMNYNGLVQEVLRFSNTGVDPVLIDIFDKGGGHTVIGLSAWRQDDTHDCISIYDPNFPNDTQRSIVLYRDSQGQYYGWSCDMGGGEYWTSNQGGYIQYVKYTDVISTWNSRGTENIINGTLTCSSANASIYDYDGNLVAAVRNGQVESFRADVIPVPESTEGSGTANGNGVSLWIPNEHFTVVNEDESTSGLEVSILGKDSFVSVSTSADQLLVYGGGKDNVALVGGNNESYRITFSGKDGDATFTGTTRKEVPACFARIDGQISVTDSRGQTGFAQTTVLDVITTTVSPSASSIFGDVPGDSYYAPAVQWATDANMVSGTDLGVFSPDRALTRVEAVAMLWRAAGCPTTTTETGSFADVGESDRFYQAVQWAAGAGITVGTGDACFSPDQTCSNWEFLTFLWRFQDLPGQGSELAGYEDVATWAQGQGLLKDTGIQAGLHTPCLRRDAVTFLYRVLA